MSRRVLRRLLYATAVAAVITALTAAGVSGGFLGGFQRRAGDALLPSAKTDDRVVVVAIDSQTIADVGELPLPRAIDAELGRRLADAGAAAVVWDLVFAGDKTGDDELAAAFGAAPATVLGEAVTVEPGPNNLFRITQYDGVPTSRLAAAPNTALGHTLVTPDPADGIVRTLPIVVDTGRTVTPSLSLAAFQALLGVSQATIRPDGVQVGNRFVPTEGRQRIRLNFSDGLGSATAENVVSAADVLRGTVSPQLFRNKLVLVGATASILQDTQLVPVDKSNTFPGVLIHANALNTMLTSSYLTPVSDLETVIISGLLALLVALLVLFLGLYAVPIIALVVFGYYIAWNLSFDSGHVRDIVYPFLAIALSMVASLAIRYLTETRQRRRVSSLFAQYVPATVAKQLEESGSIDAHLEGERLDVSLFFCDLRGFTSLSATLEPAEVRAMLNHFYDLTSTIILSHRGTVLKFVGDEVFAAFGAPLAVEDHPQVALDCAMEIQRRANELDLQLADLEIPPIKFGIGMNSGDVVAAHIGGGNRRQYDIVGDTVNLGSRLCGQAGKGEIVLPESMVKRLSNPPELESMGAVALKGLSEPVPLFKVAVGDSEPRVPAPAPVAS